MWHVSRDQNKVKEWERHAAIRGDIKALRPECARGVWGKQSPLWLELSSEWWGQEAAKDQTLSVRQAVERDLGLILNVRGSPGRAVIHNSHLILTLLDIKLAGWDSPSGFLESPYLNYNLLALVLSMYLSSLLDFPTALSTTYILIFY